MDENNDEITDSTSGHLAGVRAGAMRLQQIQRDINMNLVDARLHAGSANVLDQARAVQIERTLQSLRNERTLVEQGNLGPDYRSISAWGSGGLMEAAVSSSSSHHGGLFGPIAPGVGAIPLGASSSSSAPPGATSGVGLFGAASGAATSGNASGINWNWRPSWMDTDTTEPPENVD